ncbi:MAG: MerR family transcriptional regulator, partial [Candidatus Acidiferrales bacterium]
MQIGELAKRSGASVTTIRFYERKGLLPEPQRKESGFRAYNSEALHRLQFIRQAKALGFSLDEVCEILRMGERSKCPCDDVIAIAQRHLHAVE